MKEWRLRVDIPFAKAGEVSPFGKAFCVAFEEGKEGCVTLKPEQHPEFFELVEVEECTSETERAS